MVDLRQPPAAQREVPLPEATAREPRATGWTRWLPWLLVGFAVAFGAWLLRAELRDVLYPNDEGAHLGMVRLAEARIRGLHNPFDAWYPYLGLGVPQYSQYQSLPSIITGLLSIPFGDAAFRVVNYGLLVTLPVPVFVGARLLDLDRWEAGAAALVSPMLVNVNGYGFEWGSFLWIGSGMWSMLWALWLLPIALGLAWRAVARGERVALAAFVVGLTCAFHFITGYFVLLALGVFVLVRPSSALRRLGRSAMVGAGGLLIFSFVFVQTLRDLDYVNLDSITRGTFWVDSYGPGKVLGWLVRGEVFDYGRRPVVSLFVACGVVVCVVRARRHEHARIPLGLLPLGLLLWSGRRVVGPVIDRLPGGRDLLLHRFIIGVHVAGILLAGIGSVWLFRTAVRLGRRLPRLDRARVVTVVGAGALAVLVLAPVLNDRSQYAGDDRRLIDAQVVADQTSGADVRALIATARARGGGRIYAGSSSNWGTTVRVGEVPLYQVPVQVGADSIGFYLRTSSLTADIEPYFDDLDPEQFDLFDVKYVVLLNGRHPAAPGRVLATRGDYSLWEITNTSGYLEVVDATEPVPANRTNMAATFVPYLTSDALRAHRHPLVAFDGTAPGAPSLRTSAPAAGPPGRVDAAHADIAGGRFTGRVTADRPAWVMLKTSYVPRWTATVDGRAVRPAMLAPGYVGVPVGQGTHRVVFQYRPSSSYPLYFAIGVLTLALLLFGPIVVRRARARRASPGPSGPTG